MLRAISYFSDAINNAVRMIAATTGIITTVAGNGTRGYGGDGSAAVLAQLNYPGATAVDSAGNLYIADSSNSRIRLVAAKTGIVRRSPATDNMLTPGMAVRPLQRSFNFPKEWQWTAPGNVNLGRDQ